MAPRLSLGLCCSLLWLGMGCGQTSSSPRNEATAGTASAGASSSAGAASAGTSAAGAPSHDCQQVTFEDPMVDRTVRDWLRLNDQEPLDATQMSLLKGPLRLEGATSLVGFECASALTGLDLTYGMLTDASALAKLPKLRNLTFDKTQLGPQTLASLSGAPALRELYFAGLTTLHYLSLAQTRITAVEALAQLSLQELSLDGTLVPSLAALKGPLQPEECSHLWVRQVPLTNESWATDRERLCALGWAVRASRPGDDDDVTCGHWCDIQ